MKRTAPFPIAALEAAFKEQKAGIAYEGNEWHDLLFATFEELPDRLTMGAIHQLASTARLFKKRWPHQVVWHNALMQLRALGA